MGDGDWNDGFNMIGSGWKGESVWLPPCSENALATVHLSDLLPPHAVVLWLDHDRIQAGTLFPPEGVRHPFTWEQLGARIDAREPWLQLFSGDPPPAHTPALELEIAALPGLADLGAGEAHHPELLASTRKRPTCATVCVAITPGPPLPVMPVS